MDSNAATTGIWYDTNVDAFRIDGCPPGSTARAINGPPLSLCVRLGTRCNYSCDYCLSTSGPTGHWAPTSLFTDVIGFLKAVGGTRRIVISGGEPALYPDVEMQLRRLSEEGHALIVSTNGSKHLPSAKEYVSWVEVSLHGVDDASHRVTTHSKDGLYTALRAIESYAAGGVNVACSLVVVFPDVQKLRATLLQAVGAGARKVRIEHPLAIGRGHTISSVDLDAGFAQQLKNELLDAGADVVFMPRPSLRDESSMCSGYFVVLPSGELRAEIAGPSIGHQREALEFMRARWLDHKRVFSPLESDGGLSA